MSDVIDIPEHIQREQAEQVRNDALVNGMAIEIYSQLLSGNVVLKERELRDAAKTAFRAAEVFIEEHSKRHE